jgi:hypothetical protein
MSGIEFRCSQQFSGIVNLGKCAKAGVVNKSESKYRRHRFPIEKPEQFIWLYFRFALSYRNLKEMMAKRGVPVTYEAVPE